jgi:hypothetical protein
MLIETDETVPVASVLEPSARKQAPEQMPSVSLTVRFLVTQ